MTNKSLFWLSIIFGLGFFALMFLILFNIKKSPKIVQNPLPITPIIQKENNQPLLPSVSLDLSFEPGLANPHLGENFEVKVLIDSKNKHLVGADLVIEYFPDYLEVLNLNPGEIFTNPQILKEEINQEKGEIHYSLGSFQPATGSGSLMSIQFKAINPGATMLKFLKGTDLAIDEKEKVELEMESVESKGQYVILENK